jgi:hypothetical protein
MAQLQEGTIFQPSFNFVKTVLKMCFYFVLKVK